MYKSRILVSYLGTNTLRVVLELRKDVLTNVKTILLD